MRVKLFEEFAESNGLKDIWYGLVSNYTDDNTVESLWKEIVDGYATGNTYHNLNHIKYMVDKAIEYKDKLDDYDIVLFTIFYHDVVYNVKKQNNELKSAELAKDRLTTLGLSSDRVSNCYNQIMATKEHGDGASDTNYVVDFDLAILGEPYDTYKIY